MDLIMSHNHDVFQNTIFKYGISFSRKLLSDLLDYYEYFDQWDFDKTLFRIYTVVVKSCILSAKKVSLIMLEFSIQALYHGLPTKKIAAKKVRLIMLKFSTSFISWFPLKNCFVTSLKLKIN